MSESDDEIQSPAESDFSAASPPLTQAAALSVAALALAACGGGGGGGNGVSPPTPPAINITDSEAARFLLQCQFSASDSDISSVKSQGYLTWLNAKMALAESMNGTAWLDSKSHNIPRSDGNYFNSTPGDFMGWHQMIANDQQLRQRLSLALSEYFVVSYNGFDGFWPYYLIAGYLDILTANVFGNFRTLLEEITLNPAMGRFLNTAGNKKENNAGRQPDENYAREVMQLFTIGLYQLNNDGSIKTDLSGKPIETYKQSDITNLARVFTGYDWNYSRVTWQTVTWLSYPIPTTEFTRDRMALNTGDHSKLAVDFLGTNIPANTDAATALKTALDALFNHSNVGPFFAKQMIQRLVTSNPSAAYINRVANAFNDNGAGVRGDLKAVWRAILTDPEARTATASTTFGKVREPMVRFIQWARTFNAQSTDAKWEIYDLSTADTALGQSVLRAPSVFNFFRPGYVPPQTAIASQNLLAPEFQIHNETSAAGYINFMNYVIYSGYINVKPDYSLLADKVTDSTALLDWLNLHLTANQLSSGTIATIKTALDANPVTTASSDGNKLNRVAAAILLVMASPEYIVQK